jgi:hypothetical protein
VTALARATLLLGYVAASPPPALFTGDNGEFGEEVEDGAGAFPSLALPQRPTYTAPTTSYEDEDHETASEAQLPGTCTAAEVVAERKLYLATVRVVASSAAAAAAVPATDDFALAGEMSRAARAAALTDLPNALNAVRRQRVGGGGNWCAGERPSEPGL